MAYDCSKRELPGAETSAGGSFTSSSSAASKARSTARSSSDSSPGPFSSLSSGDSGVSFIMSVIPDLLHNIRQHYGDIQYKRPRFLVLTHRFRCRRQASSRYEQSYRQAGIACNEERPRGALHPSRGNWVHVGARFPLVPRGCGFVGIICSL